MQYEVNKLGQSRNLSSINKYDEALKILRKSVKKEPESVLLRFEYAKILLIIGNRDRAYRLFEKLLKSCYESLNISCLNMLAQIEMSSKNYDNALFLLNKACFQTSTDEGLSKTIINLIYLNCRNNDYEDALKLFHENKKLLLSKNDIDMLRMLIYLKIKLNLAIEVETQSCNYYFAQISSYNRNYAECHLKKHFTSIETIKQLYDEFSKLIDIILPYECSSVDKYTIKQDDKYYTVVTIPETNKILTLYTTSKDKQL